MSKATVLIVEDEQEIRELVAYHLEKEGMTVLQAGNGEQGLEMARQQVPDLIILDLMLPGMDGHQVCTRLKVDEKLRQVPILMLTAKSEESDIVIGLGLGADDYVTKPFSPRILGARVKALLRRPAGTDSEEADALPPITQGELVITPARHEVLVAGEELKLTPVEFRLLYCLARRPGWVYTRERIIDFAQGEDVLITERTVDVHVVSLRKKLGERASMIETVRGVGYRFRE
jgi:two-component system, OmpR family, alkaline phosphatase synthesis response regulator PhoP